MKKGDVYYIAKSEYESRGSEEIYHEIRIDSETDKEWVCTRGAATEFGTINKRSKRFKARPYDKVQSVFTKAEMELYEFGRKHRTKIVRVVDTCPVAVLKQVAELIGYDVE